MRVLAAALLALAALAAAARRADMDFEFDDDAEAGERRSHRYVYDPHSPLCRALVCKKREVCLLRDSFTALCAAKKELLPPAGDEDDVFYERAPPDRCVGCGGGARAHFLCGSDNRTYSSLCRLDLHNCVRRPAPPVTLACRGFCPCERGRRPAAPSGCALDRMADRLLDWFSVLMEEARAAPPPAAGAGFPPGCKPEVRWMFSHLDADGSGSLSAAELYALRHDARERCLRPFLGTCGGGAVSRAAWCACLRRAARPCAALARAARARGGWAPACDARGFYRPRQCHAALAACWCVDAHGQEVPGSRTKGEPPCPAPAPAAAAAAPADDEDGDAAGSGDGDALY